MNKKLNYIISIIILFFTFTLSYADGPLVDLLPGETYKKAFKRLEKEASKGDLKAMSQLGILYYYGEGTPKSIDKANELWLKAAEQGGAAAQNNIGYSFLEGEGVPQSYEKALEWINKSAEQNYTKAFLNLAHIYEDGLGVEKSPIKAFNNYMKAAELGDTTAQLIIGMAYFEGQYGIEPSYEKSFEWIKKAADQDSGIGYYLLGCFYQDGLIVKQSSSEALNLYSKAAEKGLAAAQFALGIAYKNGEEVEQSDEKAFYWTKKAADQDYTDAVYDLAFYYQNGIGTEPSNEKAFKLLQKAADSGKADAIWQLAYRYEFGSYDVPVDLGKAYQLYLKSAEAGFIHAMSDLARWYREGIGVEQSDEKAFEWSLLAAENGHANEIYITAGNYKYGLGTPVSPEKAFEWYSKGAENFNVFSIFALGTCYEDGFGVDQSYELAAKYYTQASDMGYGPAMNNLGNLYKFGLGVELDFNKAFQLYEKGADWGITKSKLNLGYLYLWGEGVSPNYVTAWKWFEQASKDGDEEGAKMLAFMEQEGLMSPQKISLPTLTSDASQSIDWDALMPKANVLSSPVSDSQDYHFKVGVESPSKINKYWIIVNGEFLKDDGFQVANPSNRLLIDKQIALKEGVNELEIHVENEEEFASMTSYDVFYNPKSKATRDQMAKMNKVALMIGNSKYIDNDKSLNNPVNDVEDIAISLQALGFKVIKETDSSRRDMEEAIRNFGKEAKDADIAIFFYAGHGMEMRGINYLVPVDAQLKTEDDVEWECVNTNRILTTLDHANVKMSVVILDACRNNPFARSWNRALGDTGLKEMTTPEGIMLIYATSPGKVASDGASSERNSPFTKALLQVLQEKSLNVRELFAKVGDMVYEKTQKKQLPWIGGAFVGNFILNP